MTIETLIDAIGLIEDSLITSIIEQCSAVIKDDNVKTNEDNCE